MQSGPLELWEEKLEVAAFDILYAKMYFDVCGQAHDRSSILVERKLACALKITEITVISLLKSP